EQPANGTVGEKDAVFNLVDLAIAETLGERLTHALAIIRMNTGQHVAHGARLHGARRHAKHLLRFPRAPHLAGHQIVLPGPGVGCALGELKALLGFPQSFFRPGLLSDVAVGLEGTDPAAIVVVASGPATGYDASVAVPAGVDEPATPLAGVAHLVDYVVEGNGEFSAQQFMCLPAYRFGSSPAIQSLGATVPEGDERVPVHRDDGIVRKVEQGGVLPRFPVGP